MRLVPIPDNIFDPRHYAAVRQPLACAQTLPAWCYTRQAFLDAETDRIFGRSWFFVGRSDELPVTGAYMALSSPLGPLILVCDSAGRIRAFANTCRHRGCEIVKGRGRTTGFVCPYHGWTYALDGRLLRARHMEATEGFDPAALGLIELRAEDWDGFVFVTADPAVGSLRAWLGDMPTRFASHDCTNLRCVDRVHYRIACNWKLLLENALEDYHTASVHRGSIGTQSAMREATSGEWDSLYLETREPVGTLPGTRSPFPAIATLEGAARYRSYFTIVYPNTQFCFTQDCMWWLSVRPVSVDTSELDVGYCFPRTTMERPDFSDAVKKYFARWKLTTEEDIAVSERQQLGLASALRLSGPLSWKEELVNRFDRWVLDRVAPE